MSVEPTSPLSRLVVFQYNPDAVTRVLRPRAAPAGREVGAADARRLWGAPTETVTMTIELDATDRLETGEPVAATTGIAPQLAALEMLLYPSSVRVVVNTALLLAGTIEILPPEAPLTLLVWGPSRAVPVRVESISITEEAFDVALFPIRARADLTLQVLTYDDLPAADPGHAMFLVHQVAKEALAAVGGATSVAAAAGAG